MFDGGLKFWLMVLFDIFIDYVSFKDMYVIVGLNVVEIEVKVLLVLGVLIMF